MLIFSKWNSQRMLIKQEVTESTPVSFITFEIFSMSWSVIGLDSAGVLEHVAFALHE